MRRQKLAGLSGVARFLGSARCDWEKSRAHTKYERTYLSMLDLEKAQIWIDRLRKFKESGGHVPEALVSQACADLAITRSSVWNLINRGLPAKRGRKPILLTDQQLEAYFEGFGSCARAIRILENRGCETPTARQFQRGVQRQLTEKQRLYAKGGPKLAYPHRLFIERTEPGRSLFLEADHKVVSVLVIPERGRTPVRPRITLFMDTTTRAIASVCISINPTEAEILSAFGAAMARTPELSPAHGIPKFVRIDNGLDFTAKGFEENVEDLGGRIVPTPPYSPHKKGKVERVFRTYDEHCCALMPCYLDGPKNRDGKLAQLDDVEPYPFNRFVEETLAWIAKYNFESKHSALGMTPSEAWDADDGYIEELTPAQHRRFTRRVVKGGRKVQTRGIRVYNRWYIHEDLERHIGERVEVRGFPHDKTSLDVWVGGTFLCSVEPQSEITDEKKSRIMKSRRKHSVETAKIAKEAKRKARYRYLGVTDDGPLKDITDVDPTSREVADATDDEEGILKRLGLGRRRHGRRDSHRRGE